MNTSSPQSKISPARRAVLAALARIGEFRVPSDFGSEHPGIVPEFVQLDPRERAFAERIYRGVLQNLRLIDELTESRHLFDPRKTDKLLRWLMRIAIYQRLFMGGVPDYAIGRQTVDHARELCGEKSARFMNAIIRRLFEILPRDCGPGLDQFLRAWSPSGIPPAIRYSLPDTISEVLASGYGAELLTPILRSFNDEETRVWIRANPLRASGSDLQARLRLEGVETESLAGAGGVFRWVKTGEFPQPPWRTECWKEGLLTVQDLGAMTAVWLLQPTAGQRILDFCAAPGGKTGQMWEMMRGEGALTALEIDPERRAALAETLVRLYGHNQPIRIIAQVEDLAGTEGQFDRILVDAPCMALGLIRRHPEIRWDGRLRQMKRLQRDQNAILESAAKYLVPGGMLAWVTCSPTRAENEDIIEGFLSRNRGFSRADPAPLIPDFAREWLLASGPVVRTRPDRMPVDGFAVTLISRSSESVIGKTDQPLGSSPG